VCHNIHEKIHRQLFLKKIVVKVGENLLKCLKLFKWMNVPTIITVFLGHLCFLLIQKEEDECFFEIMKAFGRETRKFHIAPKMTLH
jgi:hypothetical protein